MKNLLFYITLASIILASSANAASCNQISASLNNKYNNFPSENYRVSGVFIHTFDSQSIANNPREDLTKSCGLTDRGSNQALWCPNSSGIKSGGISFSYLRSDITPSKGNVIFPSNTQNPSGGSAGFTFNLQNIPSDENTKIKFLCAYPIDAGTKERPNQGCGLYPNILNNSLKTCRNQSPKAFYCQDVLCGKLTTQNYFAFAKANPPELGDSPCSIQSSNFSFFIDVSKDTLYSKTLTDFTNNEVRISSWNGLKYTDIPISSFFYTSGNNQDQNKKTVKSQALLFNQATGSSIPIIFIDLNVIKNKGKSPFKCPE